jgi:hypothetical protein
MKIILFEDTEEYKPRLLEALTKALGTRGQAILFTSVPTAQALSTHEQWLQHDLSQEQYRGASLIVADRDLSKLDQYKGLSEPTVRRVADKLGIPECAYARGERESQEFLSSAEVREQRIAVSIQGRDEEFARSVVSIADGFASITNKLPDALKTPGRKSPGKVLASILGKPEYAEKIALYASGDQNRLASILPGGGGGELNQRLTCLFGYWLWDSVLRYPGVVVNDVAASSYLDIKKDVFSTPEVQAIFAASRYRGPFADAKAPLWWRGMLDDLVADGGVKDGRRLVEKALQKDVPPSECCEDPTKSAGYYCMLSGQPVSFDNSNAGLTWFPRGADLARISKRKYAELVPWL